MRKGTPFSRQRPVQADLDDYDPMSVVIEEPGYDSVSMTSNNVFHNLLGQKITKHFEGYGWFEGIITQYDR